MYVFEKSLNQSLKEENRWANGGHEKQRLLLILIKKIIEKNEVYQRTQFSKLVAQR